MPKLPSQLPWKTFVQVLGALGYHQLKSGRGSLRQFSSAKRRPNFLSLHEPHPGDSLHQSTLHALLRRLQLSPDEFIALLEKR